MSKPRPARVRRTAPNILAATSLAAAALLGGCAGSPSNAAVVDGTEISVGHFQDGLAGAQMVSQLSSDQVLSVLIQAQVAEQVADEAGLTISDVDREQALQGQQIEIVPDARAFLYDYADVQLVVSEVGEQQFTEDLRSAEVEVNPRYGSWDSTLVDPGGAALAAPGSSQQR